SALRPLEAREGRRQPLGRDARAQAPVGDGVDRPARQRRAAVKTAVDSSVLLDVLGADPRFGEKSREALRAAYDAGALVACDVVWAEVRAHFASDSEFEAALALLGVRFDAIMPEAATLAGCLWRERRRAAILTT